MQIWPAVFFVFFTMHGSQVITVDLRWLIGSEGGAGSSFWLPDVGMRTFLPSSQSRRVVHFGVFLFNRYSWDTRCHSCRRHTCPSEVWNALCDSSSGQRESLTLTDSSSVCMWYLSPLSPCCRECPPCHHQTSPSPPLAWCPSAARCASFWSPAKHIQKRGSDQQRPVSAWLIRCGRKFIINVNHWIWGKLRDQCGKKERWRRKMKRMLSQLVFCGFEKWQLHHWYLVTD